MHHKRQLKHLASRAVHLGFGSLVHDFGLLHHLPHGIFRKREAFKDSAADAKTLVRTLEELGPGFVEAGRIIASRSDIVPRHYQRALLNSHTALPVMAEVKFKKLLRAAIGKRESAGITHIDSKPYRSNLVSETRKGILKNGKRVLVTVNDPSAVRSLGRNLLDIRQIAHAATTKFADTVLENALQELENRCGLLSDLSAVAARVEMLIAQFEHHQRVAVPEVLWEYTSRGALVQRWHNHPTMREAAAGDKRMPPAAKYINRYAAEAFAYQYGVGGVFILRPLLSDMQIGLGNTVIMNHLLGTGYLEPKERKQFCALAYALLAGESELAAKVLLSAHYGRSSQPDYFSAGIQVPESKKAPVSELVWELLEQAWRGGLFVPLGISMAAESLLYFERAFKKFDAQASVDDNMRLAIKKYIPEIFGIKKSASPKEIVSSVIL
ncbi:MAG: AarF/UbiB family protein [bacterium]|nr:AarF/UbiB family protein [bacterium]